MARLHTSLHAATAASKLGDLAAQAEALSHREPTASALPGRPCGYQAGIQLLVRPGAPARQLRRLPCAMCHWKRSSSASRAKGLIASCTAPCLSRPGAMQAVCSCTRAGPCMPWTGGAMHGTWLTRLEKAHHSSQVRGRAQALAQGPHVEQESAAWGPAVCCRGPLHRCPS